MLTYFNESWSYRLHKTWNIYLLYFLGKEKFTNSCFTLYSFFFNLGKQNKKNGWKICSWSYGQILQHCYSSMVNFVTFLSRIAKVKLEIFFFGQDFMKHNAGWLQNFYVAKDGLEFLIPLDSDSQFSGYRDLLL